MKHPLSTRSSSSHGAKVKEITTQSTGAAIKLTAITQNSVAGGDLNKTVTTIQEGNNSLDAFS